MCHVGRVSRKGGAPWFAGAPMVPMSVTRTVATTEQEANPRTSKPKAVTARIALVRRLPRRARNHLPQALRGREFQGASWLGVQVNATGATIQRGTAIGAPTDISVDIVQTIARTKRRRAYSRSLQYLRLRQDDETKISDQRCTGCTGMGVVRGNKQRRIE